MDHVGNSYLEFAWIADIDNLSGQYINFWLYHQKVIVLSTTKMLYKQANNSNTKEDFTFFSEIENGICSAGEVGNEFLCKLCFVQLEAARGPGALESSKWIH